MIGGGSKLDVYSTRTRALTLNLGTLHVHEMSVNETRQIKATTPEDM